MDNSNGQKRELPKYYKSIEAEPRWQKYWEDEGIYRYDENSDKPVFSVDTPPPTVSGAIHIGHIFSYTHPEIIIRFYRMNGHNIFYPFGFDDNGLPTERYVEKKLKISLGKMNRRDFIKKCLEVSTEIEMKFKDLWQSLGLSVDWTQLYSTIDDKCRRISQKSFIDLYNKGFITKKAQPALYCPVCRTTVAQAESEDTELASQFLDLRFTMENGEELIIATTRPELLPALTAVFVHPEDERYRGMKGRKIKPPIFDIEVEILYDEKVDKEKGTGAVMCCTFGDTTDIEWYNQYGLQIRQVIDENGRLNSLAGKYEGLKVKQARKQIIEDLEAGGYVVGKKDIVHAVNTHDRCHSAMEYIVLNQWFIKILENKKELIEIADKMNWYPGYMKERYIHWVKNLKWDWCISRQRFYGVAFPVWYCGDCGEMIIADEKNLPVDPFLDNPGAPCPKCGCNEFEPENDVLDTWATSSMTPQINANWKEGDSERPKMLPMNLRPQAHDIIRTWAFYTIVKSYYHHNNIPWENVMISGHSLDPEKKKISKSKGNAGRTPDAIIREFSADVVRYWASGSRLGTDTFFSEEVLKDGRRLVTKLWNACKFGIMNLEGYEKGMTGSRNVVDNWILARLNDVIKNATAYFKEYEYGLALKVIEGFFWKDLCDNYIELVKGKIRNGSEEERKGSQQVLYTVLLDVLKMFAPFFPHITEELYHMYFKEFEGKKSIHIESWPTQYEVENAEEVLEVGSNAVAFTELIRKAKSENKLSLAHPIAEFGYKIDPAIRLDVNEILSQLSFLLKIENTGGSFEPEYSTKSEDEKMEIAMKWGIKKKKEKK